MVGALEARTGYVDSNQKLYLEKYFNEVKNEQGFLGNIFDGTKELLNVGLSTSDCESMLEDFKNGKVSFEEAVECIEKFDEKQENASALMSNILTGLGAIATATLIAGGPIGWGAAFACGAPVGAALKAGINTLDRATNGIEDDALDAKQIAKDAISGALTGATSAVSSGVGIGIKNGQIGTSILNGMKCGATCGTMSGAAGYMTDVAFGDEEFNVGDLATNTIVSGAASTLVGGAVGAGMYGSASLFKTVGKEAVKQSNVTTIAKDGLTSSIRKIFGMEVKNAMTA